MNESRRRPGWLTAGAILFELSLVVIALALGALFNHNPLAGEAFPDLFHRDAWVVALAATVPPLLVFQWFLHASLSPIVRIRRMLPELLRPLLKEITFPRAAAISLAAGFGEEILFRGFLLAVLVVPLGPVPALLVSAAVFGVLHWITPAYALYAALFGLYLGSLFLITGSLLAPVLVHGLYDCVALMIVTRNDSTRGSPRDFPG